MNFNFIEGARRLFSIGNNQGDGKRAYFLYGDRLDLHDFDGTPLLRDGQVLMEGVLSQDWAGTMSIRRGQVIYPVETVVGTQATVRRFQEEYRRGSERSRKRLGPDGGLPTWTWQVPGFTIK